MLIAEAANDYETREGKYLSYISNSKRTTKAASSGKLSPSQEPMILHWRPCETLCLSRGPRYSIKEIILWLSQPTKPFRYFGI